MLVLALDTSTPVITAGLVDVLEPHRLIAAMQAGEDTSTHTVIAELTIDDAYGHAEKLMPLVTDVMRAGDHALSELAAVVVGIGPGPFTGLRVGMVTAASLGDALGIPVHGVPSHDGMAAAAGAETAGGSGERVLLVATDARRREVYASVYEGGPTPVWGPQPLAADQLPHVLTQAGITVRAVAGAGADLVRGVLDAPIADPGSLSAGLAQCALQPLVTGAQPGPLEPLYLRRPDATVPAAPKAVLPDTRP